MQRNKLSENKGNNRPPTKLHTTSQRIKPKFVTAEPTTHIVFGILVGACIKQQPCTIRVTIHRSHD